MMTPGQLERATPGYRSGYNDAARDMPNDPTHGGKHGVDVWWKKDYADGYAAGIVDRNYSRRFQLTAWAG